MCHPTICDVLRIRRYRVLSGVCVRRGMRAGGDVLDLYGRLPGSGTGYRVAGSAEAPHPVTSKTSICGQELISGRLPASKKHTRASRVHAREFPSVLQSRGDYRPSQCAPKLSRISHLRNFRRSSVGAEFLGSPSPTFWEPVVASVCSVRSPKHADEAKQRRKMLQTVTPSTTVCAESVADADSFHGTRSHRLQVFCRRMQRNAAAGQISTGARRTKIEGTRNQASDMVLVTTQGTVPASLQLIPRG